ncbi:hypothetical protein M8J77_008654 [Diaphorina citri]|nr:hypothetical protein M8J77_008654 [Diaphorina citri]
MAGQNGKPPSSNEKAFAFNNFMCIMGLLTKYDLMDRYYIKMKLYRLFILAVINIAFYSSMGFIFLQEHTEPRNGLILATHLVYCSLNYAYVVTALLFAVLTYKQKKVSENLVSLEQIKEEGMITRRSLNVKLEETCTTEASDIMVICLTMTIAYTLDFYASKSFSSTPGFCLTNYYAYTLCTFVDYTMILLLRQISEEFRLIRATLKTLLANRNDPVVSFVSVGDGVKMDATERWIRVKSLFKLYKKCVAYSAEINEIYSFQKILSISLSFVLVITFLFLGSLLIIHRTRRMMSDYEFGLTFCNVIVMIVMQLVKLMCIIAACSNARTQADKILHLGRKVVVEDRCPELSYELSFLLGILEEDRVELTAHDFFSIDYSLFVSFIGAATTYWVIMMQFQLTHNA